MNTSIQAIPWQQHSVLCEYETKTSGLAVSDEKGRYHGRYRGIYGLSKTGFRQGFRRRKPQIAYFMLLMAS